MTRRVTVRNRVFDYPDQGDTNYAENATGWAVAVSDVLDEFSGPGDINTTETVLQNGGSGDITGLNFNVSFVQRVRVEGIITRTFNANPTQVESFIIEGAYNGTQFSFTVEYAGDDTEVTFGATGGQFTYEADDVADTATLTIKYRASAIIDDEVI